MRILGGLFLAVFALAPRAAASPLLRAQDGRFVDREGRTVILRGLNIGSDAKLPPFLVSAPLEPLERWGVNAIRLVFNWEAYEPRPGAYDEAYLARLLKTADEAAKRGIYVILDLHQDAYSRYLSNGCGEGFPAWAVAERDRRAEPGAGGCTPLWAVWMFLRPSTHEAFHRFYRGDDGVRSAYLRLWARLARAARPHPGVIGYDLINEPWGDEAAELAPLYEEAARVIRAEDPTAILFLEPSAPRTSLGHDQSLLPKPSFGNFAYAPHYYDPRVAVLGRWKPSYAARQRRAFGYLVDKARELGAPLFAGEMGDPAATERARESMTYQEGLFAGAFASWAQWSYTAAWSPGKKDGWNLEDSSVVDDHGKERPNLVILPAAQRLSGEPVSQRVGPDSFELSWRDSGRKQSSEIFLPDGWKLERPGAGLRCRQRGRTASCVVDRPGLVSLRAGLAK